MHLEQITLQPEKYPTRERYPFHLPIFQRTEPIRLTAPVTFFIGENGSGKSTLLEAITWRCGIHIWREEGRARHEPNPYEQLLYRFIHVEWRDGCKPGAFFGSDTFRHFTHSVEGWATADPEVLKRFGGKSLVTQSHGQSMMSYFRSRYRIEGLYLLDEPETALSPANQVKLVRILREMGRAGHAQFIVATHSPILLACPDAQILCFDDDRIRPVPYEETGIYRLYNDFMKDPLKHIG